MNKTSEEVWLLEHAYEDRCEHVKTLGIFRSEKAAKEAIRHYVDKPGFADHLDGFSVSRYGLDEINWPDGFGNAFDAD